MRTSRTKRLPRHGAGPYALPAQVAAALIKLALHYAAHATLQHAQGIVPEANPVGRPAGRAGGWPWDCIPAGLHN